MYLRAHCYLYIRQDCVWHLFEFLIFITRSMAIYNPNNIARYNISNLCMLKAVYSLYCVYNVLLLLLFAEGWCYIVYVNTNKGQTV